MKVASIQMCSQVREIEYNKAKAEELVLKACQRRAEIIVLPELCTVGHFYEMDRYQFSENISGPTVQWLLDLSRKQNIYLLGSIQECSDEKHYCTAVLVGPQGLVATYRKQNLLPVEKVFLSAGNEPGIIDTKFGKVGIMLGSDISEAVLVSRYKGIDLMLIASGWQKMDMLPWYEGTIDSGYILPMAISTQLKTPLVFANLYGPCKMIVANLEEFRMYSEVATFDTLYSGKSFIADNLGSVLIMAGEEGDKVLVTDIDLEIGKSLRKLVNSNETIELLRKNILNPDNLPSYKFV